MEQNGVNFWEKVYSDGQQLNKYPFDAVVSFIYRNYPRNKEKKDIKILEVGCGTGNNLWFAAREGFNVTGIDISKSAINYAESRFRQEGLKGTFIVGGFDKVGQLSEKFDLVIDRGAITNVCYDEARNVINKIKNLLDINGLMFFNPYSDRHSSCASGTYLDNGITSDIKHSFSDIKELCFYGKRDIYNLFKTGWMLESIQRTESVEEINPEYFVYADWKVVARKVGD